MDYLAQLKANSQALLSLALYSLLILTYFAFHPGLTGPFLLDDEANLSVLALINQSYISPENIILSNTSGPLGRPVAMASFLIDYLSNGLSPSAFKQTNLYIHLIIGLLFFWLAFRLLKEKLPQHISGYIALFICAAWLLAPLLVSTVLYAVQRMAQLSTLFMVAGCLSYVIGRQNLAYKPRLAWLALLLSMVIFFPLALFSKENGLVLPLLLLAIEIYVFSFHEHATLAQAVLLKRLYTVVVLSSGILGILLLILNWERFGSLYVSRDFDVIERLLTQGRVLIDYMINIVLPNPTTFGLYHDDLEVSRDLFSPITTITSWLLISSIIIYCMISLRLRNTTHRLVAFGFAFFFLGHSLESSILPLELYFEHRNYLPAFGIIFSLSIIGYQLYLREKFRVLTVAFSISLIGIYGMMTFNRSHIWGSYDSLVYSVSLKHPNSVRHHMVAGGYHFSLGNVEVARFHFQEIKRLNSRLSIGAELQIAATYCHDKDAILELSNKAFKDLNYQEIRYSANALNYITKLVVQNQCNIQSIEILAMKFSDWLITTKPPDSIDYPSYYNMAFSVVELLQFSGNPEQSIELAEFAYSQQPGNLQALLGYLWSLVRNSKHSEAMQLLTESQVVYQDVDNIQANQIKALGQFVFQNLNKTKLEEI